MSGLLFLGSDDFTIQRGTKGNILCHTIPGFSLILFYSTRCDHCQNLVPIFKSLPGTVGGCQFGMINVSQNKKCVLMSRETIAPVKVVPYIILFYNGRPFMRYQGPYYRNELARFVIEVSQKVQKKQKFSAEKVKDDPRGGIPAYTIGHPLKGEGSMGVCYLEFTEAYGDTKQQQGQQQQRRFQIPAASGMGGSGRG
jgi:hypothetical protein